MAQRETLPYSLLPKIVFFQSFTINQLTATNASSVTVQSYKIIKPKIKENKNCFKIISINLQHLEQPTNLQTLFKNRNTSFLSFKTRFK